MRHRWPAPILGVILASSLAVPVVAARPDIHVEVIPFDYIQAECDGFDVVEFDVATLRIFTFEAEVGSFTRQVTHADTVGVARQVYPDGTTVDVATYKDKGGIFVQRGEDDFFWSGVIDAYTLRDGTRYARIGSQVLHVISWDPFEAEWVRDVGRHLPDWDPCTW
jgi:hypothetical protein